MRYAIVIESVGTGFSAYVPDLPGCIATGATVDEIERNLHDAIEMHIAGIREDGGLLSPPTSQVDYVDVAA
jgi:predicted RNase H-like HicB family nuclease